LPDIVKFQVGDLVKWWNDAPGYGLGIVIAAYDEHDVRWRRLSVYWFHTGRPAMQHPNNLLEVS
jgi:kynureninase